MTRLMLLGANGQIGQALCAQPLPPDWQLGAYGHAEVDITNHGAVQKAIRDFQPELIINAAAMTNVDQCEKDEDRAAAINFEGPANLAAQCSAIDIPMIHISTDYVFDGSEGEVPYQPNSEMNPLSVYGNTKMMGEEAVRHELAWHVILRISSVFSEFGMNLLTKTLKMIDEKDELKIVTDQKSCPTYAPDVTEAIIKMSQAILRGQHNSYGTFHLCGSSAVNRLEFVTDIMNAYASYTTRRPNILPALSSDFPGFAQRPPYSILGCGRIRDVYGIEQKPWRDGLARAMSFLMQDKKKVA